MTNINLYKQLLEAFQKNTEAFSGIKEILKENNDRSVLHSQETASILNEIKEINKSIDRYYKVFSLVIIAIVLALIVIAGAKEVLPVIGKLL
jgi:hypothetical protein